MEEGSFLDATPDAPPVFVDTGDEILLSGHTPSSRRMPRLIAKATLLRMLLLLAVALVAQGWKATFSMSLILAVFARAGDSTLALLPFVWFLSFEKLVVVAFIFIVLNFRVMLMGRREFAAAFNEN